MSKNPYFAHLPTWRNRQDLAFALDNLPRVMETMSTAPSRPHSRPVSTSSASPSSSSPSSPATVSSPSLALSSSSASSLSSPASSISSPSSASAASKPNSQNFKGQLMLDLAKECHRSRSRSCSVACSAPSTLSQPRRISSSSQHHNQQSYQPHHSSGVSGTIGGLTSSNTHYPLQFSTRAKAMAFLIEVLQSLQKEPCGCDLTKGCYCPGQDGIEDHEGKSPCYVCGEWFPDRREIGPNSADAATQVQGGRAWHEQGSLRHHVAESRVKKWLDIVWRPPLKSATTPDQETAQHFELSTGIQEDLSHQHQQQPPLVLSPHPGIWSQHPFDQHPQHQQNPPRMDPGRPWSVRDIENDARVKGRSRQNSFSSSSSSSSLSTTASSPSASASSSLCSRASSLSITNLQHHQDQYGAASRVGYGDVYDQRSGSLSTSSRAVDGSAVQARSMDPSTPTSARTPFPFDPHPWDSTCTDPSFDALPFPHASSRPVRTRTQSCFDPQPGPGSQISSFTPPVSRPSSSNSNNRGRNKPTRAATTNSTFAIPQEIFDPNYRSPTFRIKSWNPPPPLSRQDPAMEGTGDDAKSKKQTLDGWKEAAPPTTDTMTPGSVSVVQSDVTSVKHLDQQGAMVGVAIATGAGAGVERDRTDATMMSTTPTPSFRFNFTSERFKAAVQAASSTEKNGSLEAHPVTDLTTLSTSASASASSAATDDLPLKSMPSPATPVQKSAACVELEGISTVAQESERCDIEGPTFLCRDDAPAVAGLDAGDQGRGATSAVVVTTCPTTTDDLAPALLSQLAAMKDDNDAAATTADDTAAEAAAAAELAGMMSMSTPPRSMSSLSITADFIQKSAPMSPMSFITPKHKQQQAVQGQGQGLACATTTTTTTTTSGTTRSGSPASVPTSPLSLSTGSGIATASGVGHKVAGWKPLQRLMRKMTKSSNESVKPSMPRGGRMHLENS